MSSPDESMTTRYYAAEAAIWILSSVLLTLRYVGIAPGQAVPILNIQLADSRSFPRVIALLLIAALVYFYFEWRNASKLQRRLYRTRFRTAVTTFFACISLYFAYPLLAEGTRYEGISRLWYLAALTLGFLLGQFVRAILLALLSIRSSEYAKRIRLPRIPSAGKVVILIGIPLVALASIASFSLSRYCPGPIQHLVLILVAVTAIAVVGCDMAGYLFAQDAQGRRIPFHRHMAKYIEANESLDYWHLLSSLPSDYFDSHQLDRNANQEDIRKATLDQIRLIERERKVAVTTKESINVSFEPTDGNYSNASPKNWLVKIFPADKESEKNSILVSVKSIDFPVPEGDVELPIAIIEQKATEYLIRNTDKPLLPLKTLLSYALNQAVFDHLSDYASPYWLAMKGEKEQLSAAISDGVDLNVQQEAGWTALLAATAQGHISIVAMLLDAGADPDISNIKGITPLHYAARYGNDGICTLLLNSSANPDCQDEFGQTPLMVAICHKNEKVARLLISAGTDLQLTDLVGKSALDLAQDHHEGTVAKIIRGT